MEPVSKTQTYQSEDASKTNANGANLLGCPCCDTRAYAQANCCRVFYPPFPRCRACLENLEDLTFQQPCFFNPQFMQPFFHNGPVSQNYCCNHGCINTNPNSESNAKDQTNHECGKLRRKTTPHVFCQNMKKKPLKEKISERSNVSVNESGHFPQCQNHAREQPLWNYQPCNCRESLLWASNPFIIPVVSYCVFWNPQNPNENCSNYSCNQNTKRKSEDKEDDVLSNTESNEKCNKDEENECTQDCSEDGMSKNERDRQRNRSSSSFLSLHSSTHNENKSYNTKKKNSSPSVNAESDANSEEEEVTEELQIRCSDSSNSQNQSSVKSNENVLSNNVDYSDVYSAGNESQQSSTAGSEYDVKGEDSSAEAEVDDHAENLDEFSEERTMRVSPKSSLESLNGRNPEEYNGADLEPSNNDSKTKPKMLMKNFTVTNRTEGAFQGTPKILAAGGDLGGDNCVGFKVTIESEETPLETRLQDTKQNFEIRRISLKVLEEKKPNSPVDRTDPKALRGSRTGIARLIQDSKLRDTNVYGENKESENPKFQRDKFSRVALQYKIGPEKQVPAMNLKNRIPNKEKKFAAPKVRPHNCERNSRK